ncbi:O-methylsterigmatocystin oxidoreductase [Termitomyces sp. T112]|nr:O-methylsterigmatocystin oxidoreductase [Termitomyces sp. T112]
MDNLLSYIYLLLDAAIVFLFRKWRSSRLPYPPGPKPSLISGNASELPTFFPWLKYAEWAKGYGSIVHVRAYNHHIVILDKLQDANALFEKRSRIYSDRPEVTMVSLMGWDFATPFLRYRDTWHLHRRIFQQAFNKKEIQIIHQPVQILKVRELLRRLLVAPEDFVTHFRTTTGAIVMATVYDKNMSESNLAKFVTFSERAVNMISESFFPSATIVNALPILRHIPTWFPGARFHHFAAECRVYTTGMVEIPFKYVKDKLATGTELSSLTERLLKQDDAISPIEIPEADLKSAMATAFVGAADTTVSSAETFIYAMLVNPEAQRKAQGEIDSVVGRNRLPDFSDRPNLPYVEAVYREVMRWHPVTPLGLAHSTSADDVYNGYFIPKGTTVIANVWSMTHDESRYAEPNLFKPERFFDENGYLNTDDDIISFGFGRRICPGRHMASSTLWLLFSSILATFNIKKARDEQGNEIDVDESYTSGLVSHKVPHSCSITPRSEKAQTLIIEANAEA